MSRCGVCLNVATQHIKQLHLLPKETDCGTKLEVPDNSTGVVHVRVILHEQQHRAPSHSSGVASRKMNARTVWLFTLRRVLP